MSVDPLRSHGDAWAPLPTDLFDYALPPELIAQRPAEPRDASRLLVLHRATGQLEHAAFHDIGRWLAPRDLLVVNRSRVVPARIAARRPGGGAAEILLLRRRAPGTWEALVRPGRKLTPGTRVDLDGGIVGTIVARTPAGGRLVRFSSVTPGHGAHQHHAAGFGASVGMAPDPDARQNEASGDATACRIGPGGERAGGGSVDGARGGVAGRELSGDGLDAAVLRLGRLPLPPYIHGYAGDPERYQTVYGDTPGSAAAPTAGLHFTPTLLASLQRRGIGLATVTLHVGLDTFRPVKSDDLSAHEIHRETCSVPEATAQAVVETRARGGRVVAVGTTTVRALETAAHAASPGAEGAAWSGETSLFIVPGHRFRWVDAMVTNFHLPRSTLLALVSAFAGREAILAAYDEAIRQRYRFFSFGDAMLLL